MCPIDTWAIAQISLLICRWKRIVGNFAFWPAFWPTRVTHCAASNNILISRRQTSRSHNIHNKSFLTQTSFTSKHWIQRWDCIREKFTEPDENKLVIYSLQHFTTCFDFEVNQSYFHHVFWIFQKGKQRREEKGQIEENLRKEEKKWWWTTQEVAGARRDASKRQLWVG